MPHHSRLTTGAFHLGKGPELFRRGLQSRLDSSPYETRVAAHVLLKPRP